MQAIKYNDLVSRFTKVPVKQLKLLTPLEKIQSIFTEQSQQPENLKDTFYDANDIYIQVKHQSKKKTHTKQFIVAKKTEAEIPHREDQDSSPEQRKKVYKQGPFASFYELNETKLDKDQEVWYYKQHKDIIGPVSSYNMDKMAYYKNVDDQTRVAYKSVDKFVKFSKIKKIVESTKKPQDQQ